MRFSGIILIALLTVIHFPGLTQNKEIDSLQLILKNAKEDTNKVNTLLALHSAVVLQYSNDTANYSRQALILSEKLKFTRGIAASYSSIGGAWIAKLNYPEALKNFLTALKIFEDIKDKKGIAECYRGISKVYYMQDNDAEALRYNYNALNLFEEIKDSNAIAGCLLDIGGSYYYQNNYPEALKSYSRAIEISKHTGDRYNVAYATKNIGLLDYLSANDEYNAGNKKSAEKNMQRPLKRCNLLSIYINH